MKYLQQIQNMTPSQLIHFLIDGRLMEEENGWRAYENREPGCVESYFTALSYALKDIETKTLSVGFITTLHTLASKATITGGRSKITSGFNHIQLNNRNVTAAGMLEILEVKSHRELETVAFGEFILMTADDEVIAISDDYVATLGESDEEKSRALAELIETAKVIEWHPAQYDRMYLLRYVVNRFNRQISEVKTKDDIENIILRHIKIMELLHPFSDVNNRTFINLILLRCCVQHDLCPAILWDYNIFDGYSISEIKEDLGKGRENFRTLVAGQKLFGFEPSADDIHDLDLAAATYNNEKNKISLVGKEASFACYDRAFQMTFFDRVKKHVNDAVEQESSNNDQKIYKDLEKVINELIRQLNDLKYIEEGPIDDDSPVSDYSDEDETSEGPMSKHGLEDIKLLEQCKILVCDSTIKRLQQRFGSNKVGTHPLQNALINEIEHYKGVLGKLHEMSLSRDDECYSHLSQP